MADNVLPYQAPKSPNRGVSRLGVTSIALFVAPFFYPMKPSERFFIISAPTYLVGFALGLAAVLKTRGESGLGWLGLILNSIPLIGLLALPFVLSMK
jgi:hypothetical protein